jgi:hypothetical protein
MIRSTIKRSAPPRKRRATLRRGELTPEAKQKVRERVYEAANGLCELRFSPQCSRDRALPLDGDLFERMHLVHRHGKRRFGFDQPDLACGCFHCHQLVHQKGWPK